MGINIITRNLPDDKIDFDKEVVELIKLKPGEGKHEDVIRVMSIYKSSDPDAQFTHYRLEGITNNYFRKAATCNDITFSDDDVVYARLADIHYEIPEGGVPQVDVLNVPPSDDQIGGIITSTWYTVHLASGACCYRQGNETEATGKWLESISTLREDMTFHTWVKFKDDEKFYLMISSKEVDVKTLAAEAQSCRRNRYSLRVVVGNIRPILPVTWLLSGRAPNSREIGAPQRTRHSIVFSTPKGDADYISTILDRVGTEYRVGKIISVEASTDSGVVFLELESLSGEIYYIHTTFDKLEGGWNLRTDLQTHKRSFWEFYVAFTLEEEVRKAEEEKKRASAPETVIWSTGKKQKREQTGTYVTAIAVRGLNDMAYRGNPHYEEDIRKHMATIDQWIPGLTWEEVEEVRGNFDVVVRGSIVSGTKGAKEQLAKQMNGDIDTVLVGILTL